MSRPPALHGLDPDLLLGILDNDIMDSPPQLTGWQILGVAGSGGSGIVWRARRDADGVEAAIKIATPDEPETVERIEREAAFLRELRHPNIVRLLDAGAIHDGPDAGGLFMAMEFIDGPSLQHEIPEDGLPPEKVPIYFRQIAEAVAHAHDCGILHRDLKPANVLITQDGSIKVADFGLARPVHRRVHQLSLTRAGLVAGTAEYLPPEAYRRDYQPSQAADIFALGVILHEMFTGTPPRGAWKPASSRRGVDLRIDAIINRAMDTDPAGRWPDARTMLAALERVIASPPRYAGAPLVTMPVKAADCIWTIIGLFTLLAATGSLMKIAKSRITPPVDLVGDHTALTGGFQALHLLLLASVPLALWQLVRLRRFRSVPVREALPAPFGVDLGHSRMAAFLVTTGQFFCLWLPFLMLVNLFIGSGLRWLHPDDPPWVHGLSVTSSLNITPVHPWKPILGDGRFWLWESMGTPSHGMSQIIDRTSFVPFFTPLTMTLAGALLVTCLVATVWGSVRQWWSCGHRFRPLAMPSGALALAALASASAWQVRRDVSTSRDPYNDDWLAAAHMTSQVRDIGKFIIGAYGSHIPDLPYGHWSSYYGESVDWRGRSGVRRDEIPSLLAGSRTKAAAVEVEIHRYDHSWDPATGAFSVRILAVETYDGLHPSGTCGAADLMLELTGTVSLDRMAQITMETLVRTPLYQSDRRTATRDEATAWTHGFFRALAATEGDAGALLQDFLLEVPGNGIEENDNQWIRNAPERLRQLRLVLGNESKRLNHPPFEIQEKLSGGRTRISIPIRREAPGPQRSIAADLVHTGGRWICVKLVF